MKHEPVPSGKRRSVQLSVAEERAIDAEELGINLEQALDRALTVEIKRERERKWKEENRDAIESWNRWIEKNGVPLGKYRQF